MKSYQHRIDRSITIAAGRDTVFGFFADSARFADWWGAGSRIEARPGGEVHIRYPNGVIASGTVEEVVAGERIVFTYGYQDPARPIGPGGSRVTVTLEELPGGTLVRLVHELDGPAAVRDEHVPGWRFQLSLFANVAAAAEHVGAADAIDRWFAVQAEPDPAARRRELADLCTADVGFNDRFACIRGVDDLAGHLAALQVHMAGIRLRRDGAVRHCQGTALCDWIATRADGSTLGRGSSVFELAPGGRIARVVGLWAG